jgi:hypothetical protein
MLNGRTYVITDPGLVVAAQRASKTIAFTPFITNFTKAFIGADERQLESVTKDLVGENSAKGMVNSVNREMHRVLAPGPDLDQMNRTSEFATACKNCG